MRISQDSWLRPALLTTEPSHSQEAFSTCGGLASEMSWLRFPSSFFIQTLSCFSIVPSLENVYPTPSNPPGYGDPPGRKPSSATEVSHALPASSAQTAHRWLFVVKTCCYLGVFLSSIHPIHPMLLLSLLFLSQTETQVFVLLLVCSCLYFEGVKNVTQFYCTRHLCLLVSPAHCSDCSSRGFREIETLNDCQHGRPHLFLLSLRELFMRYQNWPCDPDLH